MILRRSGKTVLVEQHHHVLLPWCALAQDTGLRFHAVTLDHHTDVLAAFTRSAVKGDFDASSEESVRRNLELLHHDEHIDWALKSGVLASSRILSHENFTMPADPRITISCDPLWPSSQEILEGSAAARSAAAQVLERGFLARQIPEIPDPLILDIDLDYFLCDAALHPRDPSFFQELAERARLITVSRESDWVRLLRFRGETISADSLWDCLLTLLV